MNSETRTCQNCKQNFTIEPDDFSFYGKNNIPAPTACPQCRSQRRMLFRNFKTLYKRASDKSGKIVVSMYHPKAPYIIYTNEEWWSDGWDSKEYGRDFDFNRPFFEQFSELLKAVPRFATNNVKSQGCEYSNFVLNSKNCYLTFGSPDNEDCAYGHIVWNSKECFDGLYVHGSELCYECVDVLGSHQLFYSQECEECSDSIGLFDCRSCVNCIGCVGLRSKSYHIFNKQVTKEQYQQFLKDHPLSDPASVSMILKKRDELRRQLPQRSSFGSHNNDVSGNHIYNANNVHYSFDVKSGEDSKFIFTARGVVDAYDASFSLEPETVNEVVTALASNNIFYNHYCHASHHIYYSDIIFGSNDLFGCAGMRSASYCILNKQYSKEEYEVLVPKIIEHMKKTGEWGQFFPASLSPFAYNEAIANEYMSLTKEQALAAGFRWQDDIPSTVGQETVTHADLPKDPGLYSDDLLKQVLKCAQCKRNYKLIPSEITFYKRFGLSLPSECFNCRHQRRMDQRNRRELWSGKCANCSVDFQTSYNPEQQRQYRIYCESCYLKEVV